MSKQQPEQIAEAAASAGDGGGGMERNKTSNSNEVFAFVALLGHAWRA
jgi:hypothetical protein